MIFFRDSLKRYLPPSHWQNFTSGQTYLRERLGDVFSELMAMCLSEPGVMSLRGGGC